MACECFVHSLASVFCPPASLPSPSFSKSVSAPVLRIVSSLHTLSLLQPPISAHLQSDNHGAQASPTAVFVSHGIMSRKLTTFELNPRRFKATRRQSTLGFNGRVLTGRPHLPPPQ
ncbi:hypothetical protein J3458_011712 [Metarhizium acridum]|uniref:uncharacterized protein n=1 Tax=Metarhizium acridum TaxID=92637 RepID=UPI001C6AF7D5|nr:hypothetical protein J3458_011712 [Metarhizium acridum]